MMHATAIQDEWDDSPATQPRAVELTADQRQVLRSVICLLGDRSSVDVAATLAGLLRWIAASDDPALMLELATGYFETVAQSRGRARVVNLEASTEIDDAQGGRL